MHTKLLIFSGVLFVSMTFVGPFIAFASIFYQFALNRGCRVVNYIVPAKLELVGYITFAIVSW